MGCRLSDFSKVEDVAQKVHKAYQHKVVTHPKEPKEAAVADKKKSRSILQEFLDRPRPEALPHACEVVSGVWLGSLYDALDADFLRKQGITHAVSGTLAKDPFNGKVKRLVAIAEDEDPGDIHNWFEEVSKFIEAAVNEGGRVLVHCEWGVSRSPSLVAAHLIRQTRRPASEVLDSLKILRPCTSPNKQFLGALQEWQQKLGVASQPAQRAAKPPAPAPAPRVAAVPKNGRAHGLFKQCGSICYR